MACVMEAGRVAVLVLRTLCVLAGTAGRHLTLTLISWEPRAPLCVLS